MDILKHKLQIKDENLYFYAPQNDSVVPGTIAGLLKNNWNFDKIKINPHDIIIDIGCSVGILSMVWAKMFPLSKIYSFDANPVAIDCFRQSIKDNNINNINIYNLAIGSHKQEKVEFVTYNENETCAIRKDLADKRNVSYFCEMIAIDEIFDNFGIDKVKLLKCDIETGEFELFDHIFKKRPDILDKIEYLLLEIHPLFGELRSERLKAMVKEKFGDKVFH